MVAELPRLNSKSMKSLEIAGSGVVVATGSAVTSRLMDTRGLSHPCGYGAGAPAGRLLVTAEAMDRGGYAHQSVRVPCGWEWHSCWSCRYLRWLKNPVADGGRGAAARGAMRERVTVVKPPIYNRNGNGGPPVRGSRCGGL